MCRLRACTLLVAVVVLVPLAAQSEPLGPGSPIDAVRRHLDGMLALLTDRMMAVEVRHDAARTAVADAFDFAEMSRRALGPHWLRMTARERAEMTEDIRTILTSVYTARIGRYMSTRVDEVRDRVRFVGESVSGSTATVTMSVAYFGNDLPLHLALIRRGQGWRICDVAMDGVRLTDNIRAQVARLDRGSGYGELLARLRERREMLAMTMPPAASSGSPSQ
jgi:phospholipid transport system substrate-binding protein